MAYGPHVSAQKTLRRCGFLAIVRGGFLNLLELKNLTVSYLDDLEFGYFTQPQVTRFLNNAQRKVQRTLIDMKQNFYLQCVQTNTVANQCNLVLPQDFMMAHRVEIIIGGVFPNESKFTIEPITLNQQDLLQSTPSTPGAYFFKKNNLILAPMPDGPYLLRLVYSYEVTDMLNDAEVPDVPERYHELLAVYAALDGFVKDDRDNTYLMKLKDEYIEMMKAEAAQRQEQRSREVVTQDAEFYGTLF